MTANTVIRLQPYIPNSFMVQKYFFIVNYFVIIAFAIFFYKKYAHSTPLKLFLYFLIYSFLTEVTGTYFSFVLKRPTFFIYHTWIILSLYFYGLFFLSRIKNIKARAGIKGLLAFYLIYTIINISFFKDFASQSLIDNIIIGRILIVIFVLLYFSELLNSDAILNIKKSLFFWISIGVLFYNIGFIPVYVIGEYISFRGAFRYIAFGLNIIMGACFISGFLMSKKQYNI